MLLLFGYIQSFFLGTGAISGITIAVVVVIIIIILSSLVILVIIKKHTQVQGRSRVTHGYENAVSISTK